MTANDELKRREAMVDEMIADVWRSIERERQLNPDSVVAGTLAALATTMRNLYHVKLLLSQLQVPVLVGSVFDPGVPDGHIVER